MASEFQTDRLPLVYGNLTGGSGGVSYCPCIDLSVFRYCIADAPIVASPSATIYADGEVISAANYTITSDYICSDDHHMAVVTFTGSQTGKRIGYRGKGICDASGVLIENPIGIAYDLLVNRLGYNVSQIDQTSYSLAYSAAAAQGYIAAGVLNEDRSVAYTLAELLGPFLASVAVSPDNKIVFRIDTGTTLSSRIAHHFDPAKWTDVSAVYDRANICNQVAFDYCYQGYDTGLEESYQAHNDGSSTANGVSQSIHGRLGPGQTSPPIQARWIRDGDTVEAIQAVVVAKWKDPRAILQVTDACWRASHLQVGDVCGYSWPWLFDDSGLPLKNQLGIIKRVRPDARAKTVSLTIADTGSYMLDGSDRDVTDYYT